LSYSCQLDLVFRCKTQILPDSLGGQPIVQMDSAAVGLNDDKGERVLEALLRSIP
jgi:hypothetical protein